MGSNIIETYFKYANSQLKQNMFYKISHINFTKTRSLPGLKETYMLP